MLDIKDWESIRPYVLWVVGVPHSRPEEPFRSLGKALIPTLGARNIAMVTAVTCRLAPLYAPEVSASNAPVPAGRQVQHRAETSRT